MSGKQPLSWRTGWFYKLGERTGKVLAKVFFGFQPPLTCPAAGFIGTATVARDPADGQDTVYVGAPDGYLYALRAADLSLKWRSPIAIPSATVSNYFQWSSPTVAGGRIYIGVSSHCDNPLVRGGVIGYRQGTGKIIASYHDVPEGGRRFGLVQRRGGPPVCLCLDRERGERRCAALRHRLGRRASGADPGPRRRLLAAAVTAVLRRRLRRVASGVRVSGRRLQ